MTPSTLRGVLSLLAAVATFSMMDVALKRLVEIYPVMQVTFLRGAPACSRAPASSLRADCA